MTERRRNEAARLQPLEPTRTLEKLRLTTGKAAEFCGVSRRQLCYWTDTGIVVGVEPGEGDELEGLEEKDGLRRLYDFPALHKVLLIKDTLDHGPGLRRAARDVEQYLLEKRKERAELLSSFPQKREPFLLEQAERLEKLAGRINQLLPTMSSTASRQKLLTLYAALEPLEMLQEQV